MKHNLCFYLYIALITLPCLEIALLTLGYRPYQQIRYSIKSTPKNCLISSSKYGFALQPGKFQVQINEGLQYECTHNSDSLRITSIHEINNNKKPKVFIFGCSYTYGMGVNDGETFPLLLQKKLPNYSVYNFGVPGFGNTQSFLQLERAIHSGNIPDVVIINFTDFHISRNSLNQSFRRDLNLGFKQSNDQISNSMRTARIPYVDSSKDSFFITYENWGTIYSNWKGRERFASVNLMQNVVDDLGTSHKMDIKKSIWIFKQIKKMCIANNIHLIVAGLTETKLTANFLETLSQNGIPIIDISVDLNNELYNNNPFDSHPNAAAHQHFANEIERTISNLVQLRDN